MFNLVQTLQKYHSYSAVTKKPNKLKSNKNKADVSKNLTKISVFEHVLLLSFLIKNAADSYKEFFFFRLKHQGVMCILAKFEILCSLIY